MRPREKECYDLMKIGLTTAEIAVVMNITHGGAKAHRKRVNRQIGIAERDRLARRTSLRARRELGRVAYTPNW